MRALYGLAAFAAAAVLFGGTAFAAEYDEADVSVIPSDASAVYQTIAVTDASGNVYFMDTSQDGLPAGMKAAMSTELEDGDYILRLKAEDGDAADESFTVGGTAAGAEMTPVEAESTGETEIDGETVAVESRGYWYDGEIAGGAKIHVNFTYKDTPYTYTHGGELPNVEGKIGVQIDNVPSSIEDMTVTIG